ncbi:hypothetical protein Tco_1018945 [Tanacetum coccineum]|uniref:Uncharacterized protein n=1 Tax=Tanacetum coccineum TaxID=301880 RepID=A0ABQ5FVZ7_9ASTR
MVALLEKTNGSEGFHQIVDFLNASHIREPISHDVEIPHFNFPTQTLVADEAAFTGVDVVHGGAANTVSSIDA